MLPESSKYPLIAVVRHFQLLAPEVCTGKLQSTVNDIGTARKVETPPEWRWQMHFCLFEQHQGCKRVRRQQEEFLLRGLSGPFRRNAQQEKVITAGTKAGEHMENTPANTTSKECKTLQKLSKISYPFAVDNSHSSNSRVPQKKPSFPKGHPEVCSEIGIFMIVPSRSGVASSGVSFLPARSDSVRTLLVRP